MTEVREADMTDEELLDQEGPAIEVRGLVNAFEDHVVRLPGQPPRGKRARPPTDKTEGDKDP